MSGLRSLRRKLQPDKVRLAEQVQYERVQLARTMVKDRCEKDAEFAKDVLKAVGENLPQEIKEACEKTIAEGPKVVEESSAPQEEKPFTLPQDLKEEILGTKSIPPEPGTVVLPSIGT